ncbi:MAG: response regulator [Phycisphaerae bacterium]|jgi:DNA-binding response OmpR family regulator
MLKVLVVDDEESYRHHISRALQQNGHEVRAAGDGPDAVLQGSQFRPDVLIVDWMLRSRVHGLQVAEVLGTVVPHLQTILVTGFPSADLRGEARRQRVVTFLEKPFDLADLRAAVRETTATESESPPGSPIAILEVDHAGRILFANGRARELLAETPGGADATRFADVLAEDGMTLLPETSERWVTCVPRTPTGEPWHLRQRRWPTDNAGLLIVVPEAQRYQMRHSVVRMLMGLDTSRALGWPVAGRALIVDSDATIRRVVTAQIREAGGICHAAEDLDVALRTIERDPGVEIVVLDDYELKGSVSDFVREVRARRAHVRIIGTSGSFRADELKAMGIDEFLLKPWILVDLTSLLGDLRGCCPRCGLPLPLRPPRAGETPACWVCTGCGYQCHAILDEECATDVLRNAHIANGS